MTYSANPDALGNIRNGRRAFNDGARRPADVFVAHLSWNRGTAADYHFATGYRDAAKEGGFSDATASLAWVDMPGLLPRDQQIERLRFLCAHQQKTLGRVPAQWQLDRLLAA